MLQLADFAVGAALSIETLFRQTASFNFSAQVHQQSRHKWANTVVDKIANHQLLVAVALDSLWCVVRNAWKIQVLLAGLVADRATVKADKSFGTETDGLVARSADGVWLEDFL